MAFSPSSTITLDAAAERPSITLNHSEPQISVIILEPEQSDKNDAVIGLTEAQAGLVGHVVIPFIIISMIGSLAVLGIIFYLRHYHRRSFDRISPLLTITIALADIAFSIFYLVSLSVAKEGKWWCLLSAWGYVEATLLSIFLVICITLKFHVAFAYHMLPSSSSETRYFCIAIMGSLCASLPPLFSNTFGMDTARHTCWYRNANVQATFIWKWFTFFTWIILCIICGIISVTVIILKLYRKRTPIKQEMAQHQQIQAEQAASPTQSISNQTYPTPFRGRVGYQSTQTAAHVLPASDPQSSGARSPLHRLQDGTALNSLQYMSQQPRPGRRGNNIRSNGENDVETIVVCRPNRTSAAQDAIYAMPGKPSSEMQCRSILIHVK
jgi:hypothetical protein